MSYYFFLLTLTFSLFAVPVGNELDREHPRPCGQVRVLANGTEMSRPCPGTYPVDPYTPPAYK